MNGQFVSISARVCRFSTQYNYLLVLSMGVRKKQPDGPAAVADRARMYIRHGKMVGLETGYFLPKVADSVLGVFFFFLMGRHKCTSGGLFHPSPQLKRHIWEAVLSAFCQSVLNFNSLLSDQPQRGERATLKLSEIRTTILQFRSRHTIHVKWSR